MLKRDQIGLGWAFNPMPGVLIKRGVTYNTETEKPSGRSALEMWRIQTAMCVKCEINAH